MNSYFNNFTKYLGNMNKKSTITDLWGTYGHISKDFGQIQGMEKEHFNHAGKMFYCCKYKMCWSDLFGYILIYLICLECEIYDTKKKI